MTNHDHDYYHDDCSLCQMEKESLPVSIEGQLQEIRDSMGYSTNTETIIKILDTLKDILTII